MTDHRIEVRTELAASRQTRVDLGADGVLHVLAGPITLHLDRATCEELTTTLARAMVALARARRPRLRLVAEAAAAANAAAATGTDEPVDARQGASGSAPVEGEPGSERR